MNAGFTLFSADLMPHGHYYEWDRNLILVHVVADSLIAIAFYSIPLIFFFFLARRKSVPFGGLIRLFALFILACGTTHFFEIYSIWYGAFGVIGAFKLITAFLAIAAAVALVRAMPTLIRLRSPIELEKVNQQLRLQIDVTHAVQMELGKVQQNLEKLIEERTAQLQLTNARLEQEILSHGHAEERFRLAVEASPTATLMSDETGRIVLVNQEAERLFGYDRAVLLGQSIDVLVPGRFRQAHHGHHERYISLPNDRPLGKGRNVLALAKDGREIPVEIGLNPVHSESGVMVLATVFDRTERLAAEAHAKQALKEKEVLLQEIHHRVKNNMQVISSLLELQARRVDDAQAKAELRENIDRIETMALIHERLYQTDDFGSIDVQWYVERLVQMFIHSRGHEEAARIAIVTQIPHAQFKIASAMPIGLIVHELLSNAVQHAFPDGRSGAINISMVEAEDDCWCLTVADSGVGKVCDDSPACESGLGVRLVTVLAQQMGGRLRTGTSVSGSAYSVIFPRNPPN